MSHSRCMDERRSRLSCRGIALLSIFLVFNMNNEALAQAPVTYNFSTDVSGSTMACPACLFAGQSALGSFVYDPETPLTTTNSEGISVYFRGISDWSGSIGSNVYSDDLGLAIVGDDIVGGSRDILRFLPGLFLNGFEIGGYTLVDVWMTWLEGMPGDPLGTPDFLMGQSLPVELPDFPGVLTLHFVNPMFSGPTLRVNFQNLMVTLAPTIVTMDIKPGETPNDINPASRGNIPVAILTTDTFDAVQIDPLSVTFGVLPTSESHSRGHIEDVDGDGDVDLVLHFRTQETGITCGETEITLVGKTFGGESISGSDTINTVSCPTP